MILHHSFFLPACWLMICLKSVETARKQLLVDFFVFRRFYRMSQAFLQVLQDFLQVLHDFLQILHDFLQTFTAPFTDFYTTFRQHVHNTRVQALLKWLVHLNAVFSSQSCVALIRCKAFIVARVCTRCREWFQKLLSTFVSWRTIAKSRLQILTSHHNIFRTKENFFCAHWLLPFRVFSLTLLS